MLSLWFRALSKYIIGGLGIGCLVLLAWGLRLNNLRDRWHHQYASEHAGRIADRKSYEQAQKDAAELNRKQVQQIQQKQEAITNEVKSTLTARLELIRSELRKAPSAAPGSPQGPGTGEAGSAPCRATDPAWMCLSPEERLRAAENEERHDQLIGWNLKQAQVR